VSRGYAVSDLLLQSKLHSTQLQALFHITERALPPYPCSPPMLEVGAVQYVEDCWVPDLLFWSKLGLWFWSVFVVRSL